MDGIESIKFVYGEEAAIINADNKNFIVISDLHIGAEQKLIKKGIKVYDANKLMAERIIKISDEFKTKNLIILGDVKESIFYPDKNEQLELKKFFYLLKDFNIIIISGNHDAHLDELVNVEIKDELIIDKFAFLHGHKMPSQTAMLSNYILAGHNHIAVTLTDENNAIYTQKSWLIAKLESKYAAKIYKEFNKKLKIIVFPAFNNLISGIPINEAKSNLNLFMSKIFNYKNAEIYSINGDLIGKLSKIKNIKSEYKKKK
ncbi:MAG: metallophosphoesterase family protein [Candidatus Micrarchaeia archaeon]